MWGKQVIIDMSAGDAAGYSLVQLIRDVGHH